MKKKDIIITTTLIVSLIILDYFNMPSFLGFKMSNINFDFLIGILNIIIIIALYMITYKKIDERAIEKEKNKYSISILLFQECYRECITYVGLLDQVTVEKYIIPKIDFNSTDNSTDNSIISNIQRSPFISETIIMDFIKDGQVTKTQIEGYFRVREKYKQYITARIILFDASHIYEPLKIDLYKIIEDENKKLLTR